ncbi:MAG: winged helix-turn-helix domain-containing protein [Myxococcota bacterium]
MVQPSLMQFRFGDFQLDQERILLRFQGESLPIRPKVFDLLVLLVRHRTRVVLREELVLALWGTTMVGSGSLSGLVNELRRILSDARRGACLIRTVHARGYQFVGTVEDLAAELSPAASDSVAREGNHFEDGTLVRVQAAFERVACSGARAVMLSPSSGACDSTILFESAAALLRRSGFETVEALESHDPDEPRLPLIDRLVKGLVDHYGIVALRSRIPARVHEIFEPGRQKSGTRGPRFSEPLAAQQYQGRRLRGVVELLRSLAQESPIAFVLHRAPAAAEEGVEALSVLLNRLGESRVFMIGLGISVCRNPLSEGSLGREDSRIEWLPLPQKIGPIVTRIRRVNPAPPDRRVGFGWS